MPTLIDALYLSGFFVLASQTITETKRRPVVWITISAPFAFPIMNSVPTLEIWDQIFQGATRGNEASFMMGADEFARLKDGAQVILNGPGPIKG
jgi:hypothetical protein